MLKVAIVLLSIIQTVAGCKSRIQQSNRYSSLSLLEKKRLYYNYCAICPSGNTFDPEKRKFNPTASSDVLKNYTDTTLSGDQNNCILKCITNLIANQYLLTYYTEHKNNLRSYLKLIKPSLITLNTFGYHNKTYRVRLFSDLKFDFILKEVTDSHLQTDTFNRVSKRNKYYENKLLIYKIDFIKLKNIEYPEHSFYTKNLDMFKGMYLAISKFSVEAPLISSDSQFDYTILPLNSKFFDYKITLKNLPKYFVSFNPSKPASYVTYIRLFLTSQYSNQILTVSPISPDENLSKF